MSCRAPGPVSALRRVMNQTLALAARRTLARVRIRPVSGVSHRRQQVGRLQNKRLVLGVDLAAHRSAEHEPSTRFHVRQQSDILAPTRQKRFIGAPWVKSPPAGPSRHQIGQAMQKSPRFSDRRSARQSRAGPGPILPKSRIPSPASSRLVGPDNCPRRADLGQAAW